MANSESKLIRQDAVPLSNFNGEARSDDPIGRGVGVRCIADDLTGAAEIGGIALRYGLKVLLSDDVPLNTNCDVLVVYTNTRSMKKEDAVAAMKNITEKIQQLKPSLFYKKTDSVLRGHVLAELKAHMKALSFDSALLIPANPSLGRIIKDKKYFVNGKPVQETSFSTDPEFPIRSSLIKEMMPDEGIAVDVISVNGNFPDQGVVVGESSSTDEIKAWAKHRREKTLLAGAASFFDALLNEMFDRKERAPEVNFSSPMLLISGTTFQKNVERIKQSKELVSYMPRVIYHNDASTDDFERWSNEVVAILSKHQKAIVAVGSHEAEKADPNLVREKMSELVKRVFEKAKVNELLVEGGSTAYSIIQKLGWKSFIPEQELQQGIVRMKLEGMDDVHLTIKPGSYDWPGEWGLT